MGIVGIILNLMRLKPMIGLLHYPTAIWMIVIKAKENKISNAINEQTTRAICKIELSWSNAIELTTVQTTNLSLLLHSTKQVNRSSVSSQTWSIRFSILVQCDSRTRYRPACTVKHEWFVVSETIQHKGCILDWWYGSWGFGWLLSSGNQYSCFTFMTDWIWAFIAAEWTSVTTRACWKVYIQVI